MKSTHIRREESAIGETRHEVPLPDGRVHVRVWGQGPPALFLHGVSAHGRSWRGVARHLVANGFPFSCWLPDLLGRGASDADPTLDYSLGEEVRRAQALVAGLLHATGATGFPSLVVGHSHGAAIALALTHAEPAVRGLVLSNPVTAELRRPTVLRLLESQRVRSIIAAGFAPLHGLIGRLVLRRAGGPHYAVPREVQVAYATPYGDPDRARTLMKILADWRPSDLGGRMPEHPLVAHVVAGAHDPRVPIEAARRLATRLAGSLTMLDDGGHVLPEQHPELLARIVADVADRLTASEA